MSLLIDALKRKKSQGSNGGINGGGDNFHGGPKPKKKWVKILIYVLIALVLIGATAFISFKVLHSVMKKKIMTEMKEKMQGKMGAGGDDIKAKLMARMQGGDSAAGSSSDASSDSSTDQDSRKAKMMEMMKKRQASSDSSDSGSGSDSDSGDSSDGDSGSGSDSDSGDSSNSDSDSGSGSDSPASPDKEAMKAQMQARMAQRGNGNSSDGSTSSSAGSSSSEDDSSSVASSSAAASADNSASSGANNIASRRAGRSAAPSSGARQGPGAQAAAGSNSSSSQDSSDDSDSSSSDDSSSSADSSASAASSSSTAPAPAATSSAPAAPADGIVIASTVWTNSNNDIYKHAQALVDQNQYDEAIALLESQDLAKETKGQSALLLGGLYLRQGKVTQAQTYLEAQLSKGSLAADGLTALLGQAYFAQEKYQEAVNVLMGRAPSLAEYPTYYGLLARSYMRLGDPVSAVQILQQIVAQLPNSASYWLVLALAYQQADDIESALVSYRRAMDLNENNPQVILFVNRQLRSLQ